MAVAQPGDAAWKRMFEDTGEGAIIEDANPVEHSPEALRILQEQGVDAYNEHIAKQGK